MPVFSVIIPLYNKAPYIARTLATVLSQTFTRYEVIVVNDGSTDGSGVIVAQINHPAIRYIETPNRGASAARNSGIAAAKGSLFAFLDADDEWEPNHLEELYKLSRQYPQAGMLALRYYIKNQGTATLQQPVFDGLAASFTGIVPDFFASSVTNRLACSTSIAVRSEVFNAAGIFNEAYTNTEDIDMWVRIGIHYPVALGSAYTSVYNFHITNSLSKTALLAQKIMDFDAYQEYEKDNKGLKAFLDLYRLEYAIKYRVAGKKEESRLLQRNISPAHISPFKKILLMLPPSLLRMLHTVKKTLYKNGIRLGS